MIIDKTGRPIRAGQLVDISALTLNGAMITAQILTAYEPSNLTLPNPDSHAYNTEPYVELAIRARVPVVQVQNLASRDKLFLCDNTYVIREVEQVEPPKPGSPLESNGVDAQPDQPTKPELKIVK